MTYSEIKIVFNEDLEIGCSIEFEIVNTDTWHRQLMFEKWVNVRAAKGQVTKGVNTSTVGQRSAHNFFFSFNYDYNAFRRHYHTSVNGNIITIRSGRPQYIFLSPKALIQDHDRPLDIEFHVNNYDGELFKLVSLDFLKADNPCSFVKIRATANQVIREVSGPVIINNNSVDFVEFSIPRSGEKFTLTCSDSNRNTLSASYSTPPMLVSSNVNAEIYNSPFGATVIVNVSNATGLNLEYSLDKLNWKASNTFPSISEGDYVIYIRDQYGCLIQKNIVIDKHGINSPEFFISKSNSIRFVKKTEGGIKPDNRIDDNRMSYEDNVEIPYTYYHCYSSTDNEPTQFKTNYSDITVKAITKDKREVIIYPGKKTNNIGLTDSRDAFVFPLENGNTGIYFKSGKRYNFETEEVIGDYELTGGLPEWGKIGVYIRVNNFWLQIKNIYPSNDKQAEILEIETSIFKTETIAKVDVVFNRDNVDVYEFNTDMWTFKDDEYFTIKIEAKDSKFPTLEYESERVKVLSDISNHVKISYSNDTNTDVLFSTRIEFNIWLRLEKDITDCSATINTSKTDTRAILVDGNIHEVKEYVFEPVTSGIYLILFRALSHRRLFINGMPLILVEPPESVDDYGETNLRSLKAKLYKNNGVFKSRTFDNDLPVTGDILELPPLLELPTEGYIKI